MRVQGGNSDNSSFNHHYFRLTMPQFIFLVSGLVFLRFFFWLIFLEEHFLEFRVLTVDTYVLPSLYMGWGFSVQTLGPENFTTHELSDESCHCCDTWSKCVSKGVRCGLYMCSIYIIWDDLERVTFTFISGAILFEDNFNEAAWWYYLFCHFSYSCLLCTGSKQDFEAAQNILSTRNCE